MSWRPLLQSCCCFKEVFLGFFILICISNKGISMLLCKILSYFLVFLIYLLPYLSCHFIYCTLLILSQICIQYYCKWQKLSCFCVLLFSHIKDQFLWFCTFILWHSIKIIVKNLQWSCILHFHIIGCILQHIWMYCLIKFC